MTRDARTAPGTIRVDGSRVPDTAGAQAGGVLDDDRPGRGHAAGTARRRLPGDLLSQADDRIREASFAALDGATLYDILRLRVDVFVVEQACAYAEIDGRDVEGSTRHLWIADDAGVAAYLRVLDEGPARRLGRIVTRLDRRGGGLAGRLVGHVLATSAGPFTMAAQAHLVDYYAGFGFDPVSDVYDDDGIPHVDLWRGCDAAPSER